MPSKMVFAWGGRCTYILRSAKIGLRSSAGSPSLMCKCGHPGFRDAGIAVYFVATGKRSRCLGGNGKLPKQFEAELELVSTLPLNGILNFAAPILGAVDPEGCKVIANAIAKHADEVK